MLGHLSLKEHRYKENILLTNFVFAMRFHRLQVRYVHLGMYAISQFRYEVTAKD